MAEIPTVTVGIETANSATNKVALANATLAEVVIGEFPPVFVMNDSGAAANLWVELDLAAKDGRPVYTIHLAA